MRVVRLVLAPVTLGAAVLVGITYGRALQIHTFWLADGWLAHPDGYGYHRVFFSGFQGAMGFYGVTSIGAVAAPLIFGVLALSVVLPPRLAAYVCLGLVFALLGLLGIHVCLLLPARHTLLMVWEFPLLGVAALALRGTQLYLAGRRDRV
jgi:hypothetical protein